MSCLFPESICCLALCLSLCLSVCLSLCSFASFSVCPCLSLYLSVCLSVSTYLLSAPLLLGAFPCLLLVLQSVSLSPHCGCTISSCLLSIFKERCRWFSLHGSLRCCLLPCACLSPYNSLLPPSPPAGLQWFLCPSRFLRLLCIFSLCLSHRIGMLCLLLSSPQSVC